MNAPFHLAPHAEPFFFDVDPGTRFCMYHPPSTQVPARGAILYVHPFAEELTLSRRMAAQQARAFAGMGFAVLQLDLFGCGDSCGEFSAGRWEQWRRDLAVAAAWLGQRQDGPLYLWGLRLGALLAMDMAASCDVEGLILWQPTISGRTEIRQFLRHQVLARRARRGDASERARAADLAQQNAPGAAVRALRARLDARGHVDVGGFALDLSMVRSIEAHAALDLQLRARSVHWLSSNAMPRRLAARWRAQGVHLHEHQLAILPFWSDPARPECPALLAATTAALAHAGTTLPGHPTAADASPS